MTDSSTPRPDDDPASGPDTPSPEVAAASPEQAGAPTQPMPPAGAPTEPMPPAGAPPSSPPPPGVSVPAYAAVPHRGARGLWREATSTTGGRVATIVAAVLVALVVVAGIGLGAAAIGRLGDDRRPVGAFRADRVQGMQGYGDGRMGRDGRGQGQGGGPFGQQDQGQDGNGFGGGPGDRRGRGGLPDGLGGLGGMSGLTGILHGEFVTGASGSATTMLFQVGEVTAYTKGSSLAVKSTDGFATTYQVDSGSRLVASSATSISVGDTVRVIATKDGPTVTMVQIVSAGGLSGSSGA